MDFREYARQETSAFVDRLISAADAVRIDLEDRLQSLTADLDSAIETHRRLDAERTASEAARVEEAIARAEADAARAQVDAELRSSRELLDRAREETARLAEALEQETARKAIGDGEIERLRAAVASLESLRDEAIAEAERRAADAAAGAVAMRGEMDAEREAMRVTAEQLTAELERLRAQCAGAVEELRDTQAQLDASHEHYCRGVEKIRDLEQRVQEAQASTVAVLAALVRAVDALETPATVHSLFAALVDQTAAELPRVALFRVKGNHLEGEHVAGAAAGMTVTKLVIPMSVGALVTRAATRGVLERASGEQLAGTRSPFGDTPASALAVPLVFQGETLAVLYADSDRPVSDVQAGFVSLLVRHATVVLSKLTQELKAQKELRDYAAMLLQEAEQMYRADLESGGSEQDCIRRLNETLECGRQLYAQRAALEGAVAADLFDEQIAALTRAPESRFAEALAAVIDPPRERRTAS